MPDYKMSSRETKMKFEKIEEKLKKAKEENHRCMGTGGRGLPEVSPGPTMPYFSKPCGWATPKTALQPFQGCPTRKTGGLRLSSTPLDTPRRTSIKKIHQEEA
jgi:hypothetical protein